MSKSDPRTPEDGGDFPEVELPFESTMKDEILHIVIEALNAQGYPGLDCATLVTNPIHRAAAVDMLRDCHPLPVVQTLINQIENGQI